MTDAPAPVQGTDRIVATVLVTDLVDSTRLAAEVGDRAFREVLNRHDALVREEIERWGGREINTAGDGFLAAFARPEDALRCALAMRQALRGIELEVRCGLHTGEVQLTEGKAGGIAVHIAARVAARAKGGEILASGTVRDLAVGSALGFLDRGSHELKGVPGEWRLFAVDEGAPPARKGPRSQWSQPGRAVVLGSLAVVVAIGALALYRQVSEPREPREEWSSPPSGNVRSVDAATPSETSIAVLPFEKMTAEPTNEYFSDGMTEELISALTRLPELRVVSRTSAFAFKGRREDVRTIGERLNVDYILEGSVRAAGDTLRVTAQLVEAGTGYHVWSETYEREMKDVFAVQDEISRAIVNRLQLDLSGAAGTDLVTRPTENLEAYNLYLEGRFFWNQRTGEGIQRAIERFRQAIELDPDFALAHPV